MNRILINLIRNFLFFFLGFPSVVYGQTNYPPIPYKIDIKKNINNIKAINLSSIGRELSYIPLETTPECLIQSIYKVLFSDKFIFINGFTKLLQFERNGKFIRQIGSRGRGPEEYSSVGDFCIDEQKKEVYIIFGAAPKLLIFDFDGIFKNSFNLSFRPAQIILQDQNHLIFSLWNAPGKDDPGWIITNRQGIILTRINYNLKRISQPGFIVRDSPMYAFNNKVHFVEFGIDTLYYFEGILRKPYSIFSLGDMKMDPDPLVTSSFMKDEKILNKIWLGSIIENNDYLFTKFFLGITGAYTCSIYDKKSKDVTFLKDNVFKNDLNGAIGFWPKQIINDNILVDYVDAFDLLKKPIPSTLRSRISETSNPVLVMLK
jgi:hypothetical protein